MGKFVTCKKMVKEHAHWIVNCGVHGEHAETELLTRCDEGKVEVKLWSRTVATLGGGAPPLPVTLGPCCERVLFSAAQGRFNILATTVYLLVSL